MRAPDSFSHLCGRVEAESGWGIEAVLLETAQQAVRPAQTNELENELEAAAERASRRRRADQKELLDHPEKLESENRPFTQGLLVYWAELWLDPRCDEPCPGYESAHGRRAEKTWQKVSLLLVTLILV